MEGKVNQLTLNRTKSYKIVHYKHSSIQRPRSFMLGNKKTSCLDQNASYFPPPSALIALFKNSPSARNGVWGRRRDTSAPLQLLQSLAPVLFPLVTPRVSCLTNYSNTRGGENNISLYVRIVAKAKFPPAQNFVEVWDIACCSCCGNKIRK